MINIMEDENWAFLNTRVTFYDKIWDSYKVPIFSSFIVFDMFQYIHLYGFDHLK